MELEPGFKLSEEGPIPEDWEVANVAGLASPKRNAIVGGPFGSDLTARDYRPSGVPVIRGSNMGPHYLQGPYVYVEPSKASGLQANLATPGDVVVTQRGTLGQVSIVPAAPYAEYLISQSQMKVSLDPVQADPDYLIQVFKHPAYQAKILSSAIQTGVPHLNLGILRGFVLPKPQVDEQRAIARALGDVDAWIAAAEAEAAKLKALRAAAIDALLTPILRLPEFTGEWMRSSFGRLAMVRNAKVQTLGCERARWCVDLEQIVSEAGRLTGFADVSGQRSIRYAFKAGDVLFGRLRAYLRKFWVADRVGVCSTEIWPLITRSDDLAQEFLGWLVRTPTFSDAASVAFGTHMPRADWSFIADLELAVPPTLDEQRAIAAVLSDMDAAVAAADAVAAKARALKSGAMDALLSGRIRLPR